MEARRCQSSFTALAHLEELTASKQGDTLRMLNVTSGNDIWVKCTFA